MDIFEACTQGNLERVLELLKNGANVNDKDVYNNTPLMFASKSNA